MPGYVGDQFTGKYLSVGRQFVQAPDAELVAHVLARRAGGQRVLGQRPGRYRIRGRGVDPHGEQCGIVGALGTDRQQAGGEAVAKLLWVSR